MHTLSFRSSLLFGSLALAALAACGPALSNVADGEDGQGAAQGELSTALTLSPSTMTLAPGGSAKATLSINTTTTYGITTPTAPAGLTITLSSKSITSKTPVTVTVTASSSAAATSSFTISAHSGSSIVTATETVNVSTGAGGGSGGGSTGGGAGGGSTGGGSAGGGAGGGSGGGSTGGGTGGGSTGAVRVLFDAAHKQVAGNADWILDPRSPLPSSPSTWNGGISSWGARLVAAGWQVNQLSSGSLNWGQGGDGDLSKVDVFISDEPELAFSSSEQAALMTFAHGGGGIFLVSDHSGASRCSGCTEAWRVINAFVVTGAAAGAWGVQVDGNNIGSPSGTANDARVSSGPFGAGHTFNFHSGSSVSVTSGNASAAVLVSTSSRGMMVGSELSSGGRLVLLGDSSPADDGSCGCSASLNNGWGEVDDAAIILNATAWLAHRN